HPDLSAWAVRFAGRNASAFVFTRSTGLPDHCPAAHGARAGFGSVPARGDAPLLCRHSSGSIAASGRPARCAEAISRAMAPLEPGPGHGSHNAGDLLDKG